MTFICKQCGNCCSQFDSDSGGIMIFEWEKDRLEKVARKSNVDFKIEPGQTDYDAKSNIKIITTFAFKARKCLYLKDKRCSIHPDRPIYCKAYPLLVTITKSKFKLNLLACPNAKIPKLESPEKLDWTEKDHYLQLYYKEFGDIFLHALELEIFRHRYLDIMKNLEENNLVKLRKEKQSDNPKTATLLQFLVSSKFISQKDAKKIIDDILNLKNAKEMVGLN